MNNRNLVLSATECAYTPTHALLAKESDPDAQFSTSITVSSGPYEPTAAMLAKELRFRKRHMYSVLKANAEHDRTPYLPSREMLAKEVR